MKIIISIKLNNNEIKYKKKMNTYYTIHYKKIIIWFYVKRILKTC